MRAAYYQYANICLALCVNFFSVFICCFIYQLIFGFMKFRCLLYLLYFNFFIYFFYCSYFYLFYAFFTPTYSSAIQYFCCDIFAIRLLIVIIALTVVFFWHSFIVVGDSKYLRLPSAHPPFAYIFGVP